MTSMVSPGASVSIIQFDMRPLGHPLHRRGEAGRRCPASSTSSSSGRPLAVDRGPEGAELARPRRRTSRASSGGISRTNERVSAVSSTTSTTRSAWYSWSSSMRPGSLRPSCPMISPYPVLCKRPSHSASARSLVARDGRTHVRSEVTWPTIPAMVRDGAAAVRRRRGGGRRQPPRRRTPQLAEMVAERGSRRSSPSGIEPGDRVAVWAPNSLEWIVAALAITTAGGVLVPVNTRFKGAEAAYILAPQRRAGAVHRPRASSTPTTRRCSPSRAAAPRPRAHVLLVGRRRRHGSASAPGTTSSRAAHDVTDAELDARRRVARTRRPERRRLHLGHHRQPEGRGDDPRPDAAGLPRLVRLGRPAPRRPLPRSRTRSSTSSGTRPACLAVADARRHDLPGRGVRPRGRARARRARAHHGVPRSADDLPDRCSTIPTAPRATSRSLRVAVTGAADIPVELIRRVREELPFERILTGYGLTEAGTVTGSTPDDDFEHIATTVGVPWPGFEVRTVDEAGADVARRRARRGRRARRDRDARATSTTPRRPRPRSTPTASSTPATSARSTPTGTCASSGGSRTCSSSAGSTPTRPRSRTCCCATRAIAQVAVIGIPDARLGEVGMAFVVLDARRRRVDRRRASSSGRATRWRTSRCPGGWRSSTRCRSTRPGKVVKDELRARVEPT